MSTIVTNADQVAEFFNDVAARQLPYAALRTTQELANIVRTDVLAEMEKEFHKPTPNFTLRSIEVIRYNDLENPHTWVGLKMDRPWMYALSHQLKGGMRRYKRMEGAFERIGAIPKGYVMVPAEGCPLDAYDNPRPSFIIQLLSYFKAFGEMGYKANMTKETKAKFHKSLQRKNGGANIEYFISDPRKRNERKGGGKGLPAGIWQRRSFGGSTRAIPIFLFVKIGNYNRLIHLPEAAQEVVSTLGAQTFATQLRRAMANDKQLINAMKVT